MAADTDGWELILSERRDLIALVDALEPAQWETPSLCPGWSVRDVVGHLVSAPEVAPLRAVGVVLRSRGRLPVATDRLARMWSRRTPAELRAGMHANADSRFTPPWLGWRAVLLDVMVHRMDIAVPLDIPVERPAESWRPVLDFLSEPKMTMGQLRRRRPTLALRTTDLAWSAGTGPEVSGPAAALGLTLAGRDALLGQLQGPGVEALRQWLAA